MSFGGRLLASTTVLTGDPLTGYFRYSSISSVTLTAGQTYEVVGVSHFDNYTWNNAGFSSDPKVTFLMDHYDSGSTLFFPSGQFQNSVSDGFWGPNLMLDGISEIPEPAAGLMVLAGLGGILLFRRRSASPSL